MTSQPIILVLTLTLLPSIYSSELKLVQAICRHGDRAPIAGYQKWYPTDPYINDEYAPVGLGGLTEKGRNRSFALGEFLRGRYFSKFQMPSEYSSALFRVRSSDIDRCRKSAEAMLAALFPGSKSIPIYNQELHKDPLFIGIHICPVIREEIARAERTMRRWEGDEGWSSLHKYLSKYLGVNATRHHTCLLYDTLMAQSSFGLPLPGWTKKIYPSDEMERNAASQYLLQSHSIKSKRLNGGLWIREFLENMENVVNGNDVAKMILYVGHDTNIAGLLSALNIFHSHVPSFCSCINLEMYQDPKSDEYYVKLFYKNYDKLEELHIPGCSLPCSVKNLKFLTNHLIPRNINKECGLTT